MGSEKAVPGEREAGPEPKNSPMKMVRVTVKQTHQMNRHQLVMSPLQSVLTGLQREGHTGGEQLPQVQDEAHYGLGAQA